MFKISFWDDVYVNLISQRLFKCKNIYMHEWLIFSTPSHTIQPANRKFEFLNVLSLAGGRLAPLNVRTTGLRAKMQHSGSESPPPSLLRSENNLAQPSQNLLNQLYLSVKFLSKIYICIEINLFRHKMCRIPIRLTSAPSLPCPVIPQSLQHYCLS